MLTAEENLPVIDSQVALELIRLEEDILEAGSDAKCPSSFKARCLRSIQNNLTATDFSDLDSDVFAYLRTQSSDFAVEFLAKCVKKIENTKQEEMDAVQQQLDASKEQVGSLEKELKRFRVIPGREPKRKMEKVPGNSRSKLPKTQEQVQTYVYSLDGEYMFTYRPDPFREDSDESIAESDDSDESGRSLS